MEMVVEMEMVVVLEMVMVSERDNGIGDCCIHSTLCTMN